MLADFLLFRFLALRFFFYRPALGLLIGKMIFGTEEEKAEIRKNAGDELWGIKVNAQNVGELISHLRRQIEGGALHMTNEGAKLRTEQLIRDLEKFLSETTLSAVLRDAKEILVRFYESDYVGFFTFPKFFGFLPAIPR